jgi:protease-4
MSLLKAFGVFILLMIFTVVAAGILGAMFAAETGNVALISIDGEITSSATVFSGATSSDTVVASLFEAADNPDIQAILLEINSPGGTVVASKEITNALKDIDKPKVCLLREVAASGAYWVATGCDWIIADEFTITGSIGVSGSYLEFSGLFEQYGIGYVRLVSGDKKDSGTPYRKPTQSELAGLQTIIDEIHNAFVAEVAENRNLTFGYVANLSDGAIYTGRQAVVFGFVDELGGRAEALDAIKELAGIEEVDIVEFGEELSLPELLSGFVGEAMVRYLAQNQFRIMA